MQIEEAALLGGFFYCPIKTTAEGGGKEQMRS
jgi:hypothetical protein